MEEPSAFDYHYFDDPEALGYQGYSRKPYGDKVIEPWEMAVAFCKEQEVASAADIGCAKGFLVEGLRAEGIDAVGYDVSDYALSFADGHCHKHDVRDGIPDSREAIIALGVLMYLNEDEARHVLFDIYQAADRFFLFSAHYEGVEQEVSDPLRLVTRSREWWNRQIENEGFHLFREEEYFDAYTK